MKPDPYLGRRLIAAVRLKRYEDRIANTMHHALNRRRATALSSLRSMAITAAVAHPPGPPFDPDTWSQEVDDEVRPEVEAIFNDVAGSVLGKLVPDGSSLLPDIDMTARIQRLVGYANDIGPDLAAKLSTTLNTGVAKGEGIDDLAARIQSEFDVADRRAETIARTEVVGATNGVSHDVASSLSASGVELEKTWLATADERTRPDHVDADGQTVPIDEPFSVGGEDLMYPGDPDGSPENVINCRCVATYDTPAGDTTEAVSEEGDG